MKDSGGDFAFTSSVLRAFAADGFEVYCGDDSALSDALALGGAGCITAAANVTADVSARVFASRGAPEGAAAQRALTALRRAIASAPLIPGLKALTARRTGEGAWNTMRPPHLPLGPEAAEALFAAYDEARDAA